MDIKYKISLTGDLGSGKSTVCKIISESVGAEVVSIGTIQRRMAKEKGMTTYEFNRYMETHPEIDDEFDTMLKSYDSVNGKSLLFDSRLAWNFVPSAFSVYLTTDLMVAAERVQGAKRDNEGYSSVEEAMARLSERRASESLRYSTLYGLDIKNMFNYDMIVDSTTAGPKEIAKIILEGCQRYFSGSREKIHAFSPFRLYPLVGAESEGEIELIPYNDFYFVTSGLALLSMAIKEGKNTVPCRLKLLAEDVKVAYIAQNYNKNHAEEWARANGFNFKRYPEM